jgi:hypothetical protein
VVEIETYGSLPEKNGEESLKGKPWKQFGLYHLYLAERDLGGISIPLLSSLLWIDGEGKWSRTIL